MKTIAVIGLGSRGTVYSSVAKYLCKKDVKIVALCDVNKRVLDESAKRFKVPSARCFDTEEAFFNAGKLADAVIIATGDIHHYRQCKSVLELNYDVLLEKPVAPDVEQVKELLALSKAKGRTVVVCHVLRYANYYRKIKGILDSGVLGDLVQIEHKENIGYYHYAHSYVRGNWHKESDSCPSILAKCCHDLDLLIWFAGKTPKAVASVGSLKYFNSNNKPEGAAERCVDCGLKKCPYNAVNLYVKDPFYKAKFIKYMRKTIVGHSKVSDKEMLECLKTSNYGKCVFASDNDVMDNQTALLYFDGLTVTHTMTAFSSDMCRHTVIYGTKGQLVADDLKGKIKVSTFGGKTKTYKAKLLPITGHVEGDIGTMINFAKLINGRNVENIDFTYLSDALPSHVACHYIEESRLKGGEKINIE